jgi:ribosome-associated heat shock protein Hsp15
MTALRIDKWLWFARFCKSRSLAQQWIDAGDVRLNGTPVDKTSRTVSIGDDLVFRQGRRWRRVEILALADHRGPATLAQTLYRELSPPDPSPDD